ncbi:hypothetical protein ACJZ2D_010624 [Fusarium nematophilum]
MLPSRPHLVDPDWMGGPCAVVIGTLQRLQQWCQFTFSPPSLLESDGDGEALAAAGGWVGGGPVKKAREQPVVGEERLGTCCKQTEDAEGGSQSMAQLHDFMHSFPQSCRQAPQTPVLLPAHEPIPPPRVHRRGFFLLFAKEEGFQVSKVCCFVPVACLLRQWSGKRAKSMCTKSTGRLCLHPKLCVSPCLKDKKGHCGERDVSRPTPGSEQKRPGLLCPPRRAGRGGQITDGGQSQKTVRAWGAGEEPNCDPSRGLSIMTIRPTVESEPGRALRGTRNTGTAHTGRGCQQSTQAAQSCIGGWMPTELRAHTNMHTHPTSPPQVARDLPPSPLPSSPIGL